MEKSELEKLRYPIGKFEAPKTYTPELLAKAIQTIADFPHKLKSEVAHLSNSQLETPYRPEGWSVRQVIHHCADSHMNCLIRLKWTMTENNPTIKFYYENLWGEGIDNKTMPIEPTLLFLEGLHFRLAFIMKSLSETDLEMAYIHPEHNKEFELREMICLYEWHCNHHLAHITELKKREGWN
ncbi:YfiT family bacillithiol transferase [Flavobacterium wongokense]|uniref:YfiT family bacillithiol transferase n=1 Tax=Flavobacterium wongokense TaxID=2910674 RepID=UPI001F346E9F|nr:putative metal-dependent hydrolase [Flavobacterium sp. WG47]MCF6133354.1 putative metal-dependent hydrolase [Flavobacterium sp. WG47]